MTSPLSTRRTAPRLFMTSPLSTRRTAPRLFMTSPLSTRRTAPRLFMTSHGSKLLTIIALLSLATHVTSHHSTDASSQYLDVNRDVTQGSRPRDSELQPTADHEASGLLTDLPTSDNKATVVIRSVDRDPRDSELQPTSDHEASGLLTDLPTSDNKATVVIRSVDRDPCDCVPSDHDVGDLANMFLLTYKQMIASFYNITNCRVRGVLLTCDCLQVVAIKSAVAELRRKFEVVLSSGYLSTDDVEPLVSDYRQSLDHAESFILGDGLAGLVGLAGRCDNSTALELLRYAFNIVKYDMNRAVEHLLRQTTYSIQYRVRRCVTLIRNYDLETAISEFMEMNDIRQLPRIIQGVYDNKVINTYLIMILLKELPAKYDVIGCKALHTEMEVNHHMRNPAVFMLDHFVNKTMKTNLSKSDMDALKEIKHAMKYSVDMALDSWVKKIQRGDFDEIIFGLCNPFVNFEYLLDIVIVRSFVNADRDEVADKLYHFVAQLKLISQIGFAYKSIYKIMNSVRRPQDPYFFMMASGIDTVMKSEDYKLASADEKRPLEELKGRLPSTAWDILLLHGLCITDAYNKVVLYTAISTSNTSEMQRVKVTDTVNVQPRRFWAFETTNEGRTFRIRNNETDEYLYSDVIKYMFGVLTGEVYTLPLDKTDAHFEWKLHLSHDDQISLINMGDHVKMYLPNNPFQYTGDIVLAGFFANMIPAISWFNVHSEC